MAEIPKSNKTLERLEEHDIENNPRQYLGYSNIGEPCIRKHQYDLRLAYSSNISPRIKRLFNVGHDMESKFKKDLENIGIEIVNQQLEIEGFAGHWAGHIDGECFGVPGAEKTIHLVEYKTHNDKSFKNLTKHNSVKTSHRKQYDQVTMYMGKLKLTRCLYLGYNKNDSTYYIERIYFNEEDFHELEIKEKNILFQEHLADRIGPGKETWHECKFCDAFDICFNKIDINKNCRTCEYVALEDKGIWRCTKTGWELTLKDQYKACKMYELEEILNAD